MISHGRSHDRSGVISHERFDAISHGRSDVISHGISHERSDVYLTRDLTADFTAAPVNH